MSITSSSSIFYRLLRSLNPNSQISLIHLATQKPSVHPLPTESSYSVISRVLQSLESGNNDIGKQDNEKLIKLLSSNSQLLEINHQLQNSPWVYAGSLSRVYEALIELVRGKPFSGDGLFELVNACKDNGVPLTVCSPILLIKFFGKGKMVDKCMWVYDGLEPQMRNLDVRNGLVEELLRNGRLDNALQVLDEMLQPNSEFPADEKTKEIVFEGLFKAKKNERWMSEEEIVELVSKFGACGLFPDSIRLTKWITNFCRQGRCDRALNILDVVMGFDGPVEAASFNAMLSGLDKSNQFKKMNLLMEKMKDKGILPNVVTIGISINHLCKARRIDEALELFEKMKSGEIGVAIDPDVIIYNTLIDGLCKVGRLDDALAFMRNMRSENKCSPSASTYNCLIDGFCKAGELERSLELFNEMRDEGVVEPNVITLNCLVDGMCKHGKAGSALGFFKEMKEKGLEGNKVTYTALIGGFCAVNNIDKAMELWDEMTEKLTPDAIVYYTLISGLSLAGRMDEAHLVFSEMKSVGFQPDIDCYNGMISGFCTKNKMDIAHDLLEEMITVGFKPDSITYNTLISYFCKKEDLKTATKLLKQMLNDNVSLTVVTFGALIHGCCSAGDIDEAMKIFQEMSSSISLPPNTVIYNTLITSLCQKKKNVSKAISLLHDMKLKGVRPNSTTFNAIFRGLQEENKIKKALELMDKMVEEGIRPDYMTLEVLTDWLPTADVAYKLREFVQAFTVSDSKTKTGGRQVYAFQNIPSNDE